MFFSELTTISPKICSDIVRSYLKPIFDSGFSGLDSEFEKHTFHFQHPLSVKGETCTKGAISGAGAGAVEVGVRRIGRWQHGLRRQLD